MSQAKALAILGAGVLAAAGGLYWVMQDDGAAEPTASTEMPAPERRASSEPPPPVGSDRAPNAPSVTVSDEPRAPTADPPTEYEVDGKKVRDHRTGDRTPMDIPPAVHPPEGRRLPSTLTQEIGQKVRVKVAECAAAIPTEARSNASRVEGLVVVAIKNKQVAITKAVMQIRNVEDAAVEQTKQCIESASLAVTNPTDEADLEAYDINVSFAL